MNGTPAGSTPVVPAPMAPTSDSEAWDADLVSDILSTSPQSPSSPEPAPTTRTHSIVSSKQDRILATQHAIYHAKKAVQTLTSLINKSAPIFLSPTSAGLTFSFPECTIFNTVSSASIKALIMAITMMLSEHAYTFRDGKDPVLEMVEKERLEEQVQADEERREEVQQRTTKEQETWTQSQWLEEFEKGKKRVVMVGRLIDAARAVESAAKSVCEAVGEHEIGAVQDKPRACCKLLAAIYEARTVFREKEQEVEAGKNRALEKWMELKEMVRKTAQAEEDEKVAELAMKQAEEKKKAAEPVRWRSHEERLAAWQEAQTEKFNAEKVKIEEANTGKTEPQDDKEGTSETNNPNADIEDNNKLSLQRIAQESFLAAISDAILRAFRSGDMGKGFSSWVLTFVIWILVMPLARRLSSFALMNYQAWKPRDRTSPTFADLPRKTKDTLSNLKKVFQRNKVVASDPDPRSDHDKDLQQDMQYYTTLTVQPATNPTPLHHRTCDFLVELTVWVALAVVIVLSSHTAFQRWYKILHWSDAQMDESFLRTVVGFVTRTLVLSSILRGLVPKLWADSRNTREMRCLMGWMSSWF